MLKMTVLRFIPVEKKNDREKYGHPCNLNIPTIQAKKILESDFFDWEAADILFAQR